MADVYTRIGYIKGATGATGAQGAKGDTGDAATISVGTVTTVPYGQTANVVNSGTSGAAVFDFTIPQGRPGQETTDMQNLTLGSITTSSASFPIPAVGETGKVLWGKVVKWFSDMAALVATKFDANHVVNNLTTTASGYALDARQGANLVAKNSISNIFAGTGLYDGTSSGGIAAGETATLSESAQNYALLVLFFGVANNASARRAYAFYPSALTGGTYHTPVAFGNIATYARIAAGGTTLSFAEAGHTDLRLLSVRGMFAVNP